MVFLFKRKTRVSINLTKVAVSVQEHFSLHGPDATNGIRQMLISELGGTNDLRASMDDVTKAVFKLNPGEVDKARAPLLKLH